jgi:hypothetical protein
MQGIKLHRFGPFKYVITPEYSNITFLKNKLKEGNLPLAASMASNYT